MPDREADRQSIRAIVATHEQGFNEKDPARLQAHYRERSWAVDATGHEVEGRAAMAVTPPEDQHARFEPGHVEFLGDHVAIMHAYVSATDPAGEPKDVGHGMIKLYVFARTGSGDWEVVARQDTLVRR